MSEQWQAKALHDGRCFEFIAKILCDPLFGDYRKQTPEIQTGLLMAAGFAVKTMRESGWDLMFAEDGEFLGVVT